MKFRSFNALIVFALLLSLLGSALTVTPARAASFNVSTAAELITAINTANSNGLNDTITLTANITLTTANNGSNGLPIIGTDGGNSLTINGNGFTLARSSAGGTPNFRIMEVGSGATLTLQNITISNGYTFEFGGSGGGVLNSGTLNITNSVFTGNSGNCDPGCGAGGGAIASFGSLSIDNSIFSNNTIDFGGGAVYTNGTATITNSTFSLNSADMGGGIYNASSLLITSSLIANNNATSGGGIVNFDTLTIANSTITDNSATTGGGGLFNWLGTTTSINNTFSDNASATGGNIYVNNDNIELKNTIVSTTILLQNNCAGGGIVTAGADTLATDLTCGSATPVTAAMLNISSSPANNGGPTQTIALQSGSVAIDAGNATACSAAPVNNVDQRGLSRLQGTSCDIGAYEAIALGNLVWNDLNNDGLLNGSETGIDNVTVQLWSGDGSTLIATTTTSGGGFYTFTALSSGDYIVRLPALNFNPGGVLRNYHSSTGPIPTLAYEPAPDPDTDTTDSDDNGTETNGILGLGGYIQTLPITLPSSTSNAVDFGVNNSPGIDLTVTKTDGQTSYKAGDTLTYTIVVSNNGPADAGDPNVPTPGTGMSISDTRPPQIASWTWTCVSSNYGCDGGTGDPFTDELFLPQLASVTYTVVAQVSPLATGTLTNSVSVIPPTGMVELTPFDNTAEDMDTDNNGFPVVSATSLQTTYTSTGPSTFTVTFNEDVSNAGGGAGTDDVTNINNYKIINKGTNGTVDTASCASALGGDDSLILPASVTYINPTAIVNLAAPLPVGSYRLFVCGTTSIVNLVGNALAGDGVTSGTDFTFDFTVGGAATVTTETTNTRASSLPKTGFAPNKVTSLPVQPATLAYASLGDLWLEIPSLNVKSTIVGVPQSKDNTWDVSWLGNNTGWLNGTAFPTWTGNSVLTAHVTNASGLDGPFAALKSLKYGDQIIIHFGGVKYVYEVRETKLARPNSTSYAFQSMQDHSYLTLVTCSWYNPLNETYLFRRVVRAVLVSTVSE